MISESTVLFDSRDQVLRCSGCFEAKHVSRAVLSDPQRYIELLEQVQTEHAGCTFLAKAPREGHRGPRRHRAGRRVMWSQEWHLYEQACAGESRTRRSL